MVAAAPTLVRANPRGWLRDARFDLAFVVGVLAIAGAMTAIAGRSRPLFVAVLTVDLWVFAYPHVASTYTRLALDRASVREHRLLLFALPPLVLLGTAGLAFWGGAVALNTLYFHWQSFHYTKQSYGIARAYARAGGVAPDGDRLSDFVVLAVPFAGVLHRVAEHQPIFYATGWWCPPLPAFTGPLAVAGATIATAVWVARALARWRAGRLSVGHALFVGSHLAVSLAAYVLIPDITLGWLLVNVWHNLQYLLFVWAWQRRRFARGVEAERPLASWLAQPGRAAYFLGACVLLGGVFYRALGYALTPFAAAALPVILIAHQTVNFHHYLVDAFIWRARKAA